MSNLTIVFDIDGTLIRGGITNDNTVKIYPRPGLKDLFRYVFKHFYNVCIWTAAKQEWLTIVKTQIFDPILSEIEIELKQKCQFKYLLNNLHCSVNLSSFYDVYIVYKPLSKLWAASLYCINSHNTLIVDDIPETFRENPENGILIPEFKDQNDIMLYRLMEFLDRLLNYYRLNKTVIGYDKSNWFQ